MNKRFGWTIAAAVLILSVLACQAPVLGRQLSISTQLPPVAATLPVSNVAPTQALPPAVAPSGGTNTSSVEDALVALYQNVSPGVVLIQVTTAQGDALGSGFVYDTAGDILTNYHVVDGATNIEVDFPSGFKAAGKVIGTDLDFDLAVVKVSATADELKPLSLGDSDQLKVGQTVVAIGNPFGLSDTMTVGIVSGLGRTLDSIRQTQAGDFFTAGDIIQTDAAINPGNSGGPLLNLAGEVVGVNRAISTTSTTATGEPTNSGIGFAVSSNIVKRVVPDLIKNGKYDYPYLGISALPEVSLMDQEALGLSQSTGAYVVDVVQGGPADKAGILAGTQTTSIQDLNAGGDLIIAIDNHPVLVFGDLLSYLMNNKQPGDQVTLTILRNNQKKEVTLTLGKRP